MMPGDARAVLHVSDTVKHVEVIISPATQQCVHVRVQNSSRAPGYVGCGAVKIREALLETSSPTGWRVVTVWSAP